MLLELLSSRATPWGLFIIACIGVVFSTHTCSHMATEKQREYDNYKAAMTDSLIHHKTKDGKDMIVGNQQVVTVDELKDTHPKVIAQIKNIGIKPKHVESVDNVVTRTKDSIHIVLKDSIIYHHVWQHPIYYEDLYDTVRGMLHNDSLDLQIVCVVPITIIPHFERELWLGFLPLGKKIYRVSVESDNFNTRIISNEYLKVK